MKYLITLLSLLFVAFILAFLSIVTVIIAPIVSFYLKEDDESVYGL